jgi:two-component system sensor histidine kinase UhpB
LTNIARHAQAKQVEIQLDREGDHVTLRITDDGCGFNLDEMRTRALAGDSIGVLGMQERATLVGGELTIESVPGQGSTVQFRAPWRTHEDLM